MSEKIALVTGSSRGLGKDIALRLTDAAAGVAVHYKRDARSAGETVRAIEHKGKLSATFQADLTKEAEALRLIESVEKKFGRLDILVNNVGPILVKPWEKVSETEWESVFRGNLMSAVFCMRAALPGMRRRKWGRIVNIGYSRVEQLAGYKTIVPYAAAKTGLLILTRSVAAAEASSGITANMVSPGLMEGGALPSNQDVPLGRLGTFKDVSQAVIFLVSEEAGYITGTNLVVAGGWKI